MKVQEMIDALMKIEDKESIVTGEVYDTNLSSHGASSIRAWAKNIDTHLKEQKI